MLFRSGRRTHRQVQGLSKGNVAPIGQVGDDEPTAVADILIVVIGAPVANPDDAYFAVLLDTKSLVLLEVEAQLLLPLERLHVSDLLRDEVRDDITLLDIDGDDGDDLGAQIIVKVGTDALDQGVKTLEDDVQIVLHRGLRA